MGGAERAERRRRQQQRVTPVAAKRPPEADRRASTKKIALWAGAVVVVAALIGGGLLWTSAVKNETEGQVIPAKQAASDVAEQRDGVVVTTGAEDAPVTIDVYADFLCPACRAFEEQWGPKITERVEAGELRVRRHMIPMLVAASDPPGYSLDAANAGLCAADEGEFAAFHDSLFAAQPDEGKRGWDKGQLTALGRDIGISGDGFAACVDSGRYDQQLTAEFAKVRADTRLHRDFGQGPGFSTPTIVGQDGVIDTAKQDWLDSLS